MVWMIYLIGVLLVLLALVDVFMTVLSANDSRGPVEETLSRVFWRIFRFLDLRMARGSQRFAALCGPVLVATLLASWSTLLILGFSLIYWPMPRGRHQW